MDVVVVFFKKGSKIIKYKLISLIKESFLHDKHKL